MERAQSTRAWRGMASILAAGTLWGTVGVTTQTLYSFTGTNAFSISAIRLLIAGPLLALVCWLRLGRGMFNIRRRDLGLMLLIGSLIAIDQLLYFLAIAQAGVALATLITICGAPVFVALITVFYNRQRIAGPTLLALGMGVVGTGLLVGVNPAGAAPTASLIGVGLALLAAFVYALILFCGRFLAGAYHPLQVNSIGFLMGAALLTVIASGTGFILTYPARGWAMLVYLGVIPTALGYGLFLVGMRSTQTTAASILVLAEPLTATLLAVLLLGEHLSPLGIGGAGLLVGAMLLLSREPEPTG
jgi:DME family drug/metabolite transporter